MNSLFIFHRDLSIDDNIGLINCLRESDVVYCIFIFTPTQATPQKNKYYNKWSFSFMLNSLRELSGYIKISFFYGESEKCIINLIKQLGINAVWENEDFSPFAAARQKKHARICADHNIDYYLEHSITLMPMGAFNKKKNKAYVKFTPFYENAKKTKIPLPQRLTSKELTKISKKKILGEIKLYKPEHKFGGRTEALKLIQKFKSKAGDYSNKRNYPAIKDATSGLGAHLHFGTMTAREVYSEIGAYEFRKQLYWREFFMYITRYVATSYVKKNWTTARFNDVKWRSALVDSFRLWCVGKTGVPIVDAGMRELLTTGRLHNRLRMICAMYLIHYLGVHWKEGEKWFAKNLLDYSYSNNYGGWTWCAGFETYSNPYFRIFSMEQQHRKYDPESIYVKEWCPELKELDPRDMFFIYKKLGLDDIRKKRIEELRNL